MAQTENGKVDGNGKAAKAALSKQEGERELVASAGGNGVRVLTRRNDNTATPEVQSRVVVNINSNIIDRFEGQTDTWAIWGTETNKEYVARRMDNAAVQTATAEFFTSRALSNAIVDLVKIPMFKPKETLFTKAEVYAHILDTCENREVAQVVMEMVLPTLIKIEMVSANGRFAQQVTYPFARVDVRAIAGEVSIIQAFGALQQVRTDGLMPDRKQSRTVFADTLAELFRPVGLALAGMAELSSIVDDIVSGVRAHLTPPGSVASENIAIPSLWYKHPLIAEYAGCLPFIRAALVQPKDKGVRLKNESSNLEEWLRLITQMLRDSPRFAWVSKAEALRHYGTYKVRDVYGAPVSLVARRSVQVDPVAQAVVAVKDAVLKDSEAYDISPTRDAIAESVQSAYGKASFATDTGAGLIQTVAENLTSLGYKGMSAGFMVDAWGEGLSLYDLAALKADKVFVAFSNGMVMLNDTADVEQHRRDPRWWYATQTTEKQLRVLSGQHYGSEVLTSDPVEALLAVAEFDPKDVMPARKQLLGPNAFGARVMNFENSKYLIDLQSRFSFDMNLAGQKVRGSFKIQDFASLRTLPLTRLVKPHFNTRVVEGLGDAYATAVNMVTHAGASAGDQWLSGNKPSEAILDAVVDTCVVKLLQLSQQLSPSFRQEVQRAVVERVLASEQAAGENAMALRGRLTQDFFTAYCDLIALQFFLFVQGMAVSTWHEMIASSRMERICLTFGSDREPTLFT